MNEQLKPPEKPSINIEALASQVIDSSECHINISQKFILTTEDKINLCLSKHLKQMERKRSWIAPFGIFIAIIGTFVTKTFKLAFGLSPDTWFAIYIIAAGIIFFWLIKCIKEAVGSKKIEDIVNELKENK